MAKSPAINWYFDNWHGGTLGFNRHQKGCYIDLLNAQFQLGPLSLEQIKNILGSDFPSWDVIKCKFVQDADEKFFNERLAAEIDKRNKFSEKQKKNGEKGGRPSKNLKIKEVNKTQIKPKNNPIKTQALTQKKPFYETEIEIENEFAFDSGKGGTGGKTKKQPERKPEIHYPFGLEFLHHWEQWKIFKKKEFKFQYKSTQSEQAALKELVKLSTGSEQTAIAILHQSMAHGWKGFFELKSENRNGAKSNSKSAKQPTGADVSMASIFAKIAKVPD